MGLFKKKRLIEKVYKAFNKKKFRRVIRLCNKILKNSPRNVEVIRIKADALIQKGKKQEAIQLYEEAGRISSDRNQPEKTIRLYKKLIEINPEKGDYYYQIGRMYELSGLNEEASMYYERASEKFISTNKGIESLNSLQNSIRLKPNDINLRLKLANSYQVENLVQNALTEYISVAEIYLDQGNYDTALSIVKKAVEIAPNNPEVHYGMGIIYLNKKNIEKAVEELKATIHLNPGHLNAYRSLADIYMSRNNYSNADMIYRRCLKIDPDCTFAIEGVADVLATKNLDSDSLEYYSWALRLFSAKDSITDMERIYRKILNLFPTNAFALEGWGDLSVRRGMLNEAIEKYKKVMDMYIDQKLPQNALEIGSKILQISPTEKEIKEKVNDIEYAMKYTNGDLSSIAGTPETGDNDGLVFNDPEANLILELVLSHKKKNDFDEAINECKRLINEVPNDPKALALLGDLYSEIQNFKGAIFAYGTAAEMLGKANNMADAIKVYKKMTESLEKVESFETGGSPKSDVLIKDYIDNAEKLVKEGKVKPAAEIYKKILSIYPQHPVAKEKLTELSMMDIFDERIKRDIEEGDYYSHFNIAIAYREMGMFEKAIEHFEVTLSSKEYYLQACDMISACYEKLENTELAVLWCKKGINNNNYNQEDKLELKYRLGSIYEKIGNIGSALRWFTDVFKENYKFRNIGQKVTLLSQKLNKDK